ncbi:MAG: restriction endonuclease [Gammaproteobacteria bacterium]|nr:restriction endonuclease [Gammaproteobacteria bacterium]
MSLSTTDLAGSGEKPQLTLETLLSEAAGFAAIESMHDEPTLYGVTDGKAVGTYLEHKFQRVLKKRYIFETGSSAKGIDFPSLNVDMKVTSTKQPQSSSPFRSARQKVLGLGYSLLLFVYQKSDDGRKRTARLSILNTVFVDESRTADYQMTRGIREIIMRDGNEDDLMALMLDRNLHIDEDEARTLARELLGSPPKQGYLTISNALQWRLQYARVISYAGEVDGVIGVT